MVMGNVAEEELVEKAVMSAGPIALNRRPVGLELPVLEEEEAQRT
jgi:hypothetical protein